MRYVLAALLALSPSVSLACVMYVPEELDKAMAEVDHAAQQPAPVVQVVPVDAVPTEPAPTVAPVAPETVVPATIPEAVPAAAPVVPDPKS